MEIAYIVIGIIIGTYSTLFVATPIAYEIQKKKINKHAKKVSQQATTSGK